MPKEARCIRPVGDILDETNWDVQTELLAQAVEVMSVLAADKRYKEPREIPRPWDHKPAPPVQRRPDGRPDLHAVPSDEFSQGVQKMLGSFSSKLHKGG